MEQIDWFIIKVLVTTKVALARNLFGGFMGAFIYLLYLGNKLKGLPVSINWKGLVFRAVIGVLGGSFVAAFLIQPAHLIGAVLTGLSWDLIVAESRKDAELIDQLRKTIGEPRR